ncbi:MAG: DAK2 domain-containing protein [Patulibacter sp.]|nr:DAK2 domain-containing protein [Patulibacter sp.]
MSSADPNIEQFRHLVAGALDHLESRRQEINDLNVFPVADGDTGDNMALTLQSVVDELDVVLAEGVSLDDLGRDELVRRLARAALLGARGNSGVILSQLIRGATEELVARPGELISPPLIAAALAGAAHRGYDSVRQPVEGTVLTVIREMAGAAAHAVAQLAPRDLGTPVDEDEQAIALAAVLGEAIAAGQRALDEGPELLAALKEAGVVDAGGFGLLVMFAGVIRTLRKGQPGEDFDIRHYDAARLEQVSHESETYRFCTNFAVIGEDLDAPRARRQLAEIGDSIIVVVGDEQTLKIHVHTDEPDRAMGLFDGVGEVSRVDVADMDAQVAAHAAAHASDDGAHAAEDAAPSDGGAVGPHVRTALVAVVSGVGIAALLRSVGAVVLDGGPTMNPSTADLLGAIERAASDEVVLLPNNGNVLMAAERAAELADKRVVVVPTRSQQAGVAIAVGHEPDASADENAAALTELHDELTTAGVAPAARDDAQGRFVVGDAVGYVADELVAWGDPADVLRTVLACAAEDRELLTVLTADDTPVDDDALPALVPDGVEIELAAGGQPSWWWLVAAE